ncbi:hypothetical protein M758_UG038000 [Ceratodon purpureus]|nr:hypothetical protein M758_UG038000 [Ceratodon purpureus]
MNDVHVASGALVVALPATVQAPVNERPTDVVPVQATVASEGEHALRRKRGIARNRTRRTRRLVYPALTSTAPSNVRGRELAIQSLATQTENLASTESLVGGGSDVQRNVDAVGEAIKEEVTYAEDVKVEPQEALGDYPPLIVRIPRTVEACQEQLMRRIVTGKDALISSKAILAK